MRSLSYIAVLASLTVAFVAAAGCTVQTIAGVDSAMPGTPPPLEAELMPGLAIDWRNKAAAYLETRSADWLSSPPSAGNNVKCATSCHTTFPHMMAKAALGVKTTAGANVRAEVEARVAENAKGTALPYYGTMMDTKGKESYGTEAILAAAVLSLDDVGQHAALSDVTKGALERMWSLQRADGTWNWLEYGLEPWETRNDFAAVIALITAGSIPEASTAGQAAGVAKVVAYLQKRVVATTPPLVLHDRVAVLWASGVSKSLLTTAQRDEIVADLVATQLNDGGFSLGSWGKGSQAQLGAGLSDGYATAFATLALCKGVPDATKRDDVKKALLWIATNQQADGSWPGRSVNSTGALQKTFMTDAATAYTALAITACIPPK